MVCSDQCCSSRLLFQNLLEKAAERETRQEYALAMIQCKVLKQLENLEQQKYDDEDITEDIKFLLERLGESVQDLRYSGGGGCALHQERLMVFKNALVTYVRGQG